MSRTRSLGKIISGAANIPTAHVDSDFTVHTNLFHVDTTTDRVGVGTNSPDHKLDVRGNVTSTGNGITTALSFADAAIVGSFSNHPLDLYTNTGRKIRVTTDGNVGVGTNAPQQKLDVMSGTIVVRSEEASAGTTANAGAVNNLLNLRMPYSASPESGGNAGARVGIKFTGRNDGADYSADGGKSASIYGVSEDGGAGYNRSMGMSFYTSPFDGSQVERMYINSIGYVKIGQGNPYVTLDVQTPSFGNGVLTRQGNLYTFARNFVNTDVNNNPITVFTWGYDHANWNNQYIKAEVFNEYYWSGGEGAWILDSQANIARQLYNNNSEGSWSSSAVQVNSNLTRRTWTWTGVAYRTYGIRLTFRNQPVGGNPNAGQVFLF